MDLIGFLKETYGYNNPIILKDLRIGGKSKSAIRKELSRAAKTGKIVREANGIYSLSDGTGKPSSIPYDSIAYKKYIEDDYGFKGICINVYGYYSGYTFLNQIGLSQQVPAVIEITTNKTSCKRTVHIGTQKIILRKARTTITNKNYKILQFLDMFHWLEEYEIDENIELIKNYIKKYLTRRMLEENLIFYPTRTIKILTEKGLLYEFR